MDPFVLQSDKKFYFASDFHLGSPNYALSLERERKIIRWLTHIEPHAQAIFLVGDIFDFWFEYKRVVPKGFVRVLGKLAQLSDSGIALYIFTGNHDLWMKNYLSIELNAQVFHQPIVCDVQHALGGHRFYIGHGDGLGPGDYSYKFLKTIFTNSLCQWLFRQIHPDLGVRIATLWSGRSRAANLKKNEERFLGTDKEWLFQYCSQAEAQAHHDFYVFGHRHLPLDLAVSPQSRYVNLGEWFSQCTYAEYDGYTLQLKQYIEQ